MLQSPADPALDGPAVLPAGASSAGGIEVVREALERTESLHAHHHICFLYSRPEEQRAFMGEFIRIGLQRGEQCFYIADENTPAQVAAFLGERGVDVDAEAKAGRLAIVTKRETYLRAGHFDPGTMLAFVRSTVEATRRAGFPAARLTGEMTWALGPEPGCERVVEYEAMVNDVFRNEEVVAVCQYNLARFPADVMVDIIMTHPIVVIDGKVCRNFYYVPPEQTLRGQKKEVELERLIENLVAREDQERERVESARRAEELQRLQELDRIKTQFISAAAHELGNPLTPMTLQLSLLKTKLGDGLTPRQRDAVAMLERNTDRLARLVQDLLEVTRLQAGRVELERTDISLTALVHETAAVFHEAAAGKHIHLEVAAGPELRVVADERRIVQVLYNLLSNALKFTPEGGHVRVESVRTSAGVVVRVQDSGIGLGREDIDRLFQPFHRVQPDKARPGTGLGLYICKGLVELHGGRAWCESAGPGQGSTFAFMLPSAAPLPPA